VIGWVEGDLHVHLYSTKEETFLWDKEMKNKLKGIQLSKDRVYLLESSSTGPTNLLSFKMENGEKLKNIFLHKKGCNVMRVRDSIGGFTLQNGMDVHDVLHGQHFSSTPNLHSFALSCCDVKKVEDEIHVLSGSLDQSLVYHPVSATTWSGNKFYWFIILILSMILFYIFKK
jgi:hypothetical protein